MNKAGPKYEYKMHPDDPHTILVRVNTGRPLALRGRHQDWKVYGLFWDAMTVVFALLLLRKAQEREM